MSTLKTNRIENLTTTAGGISIDNGGRVGLGTSTPGNYSDYADNLVVNESGNAGISISSTDSSSNVSSIQFTGGTTRRHYIECTNGTNGNFTFQTGGTGSFRFIDGSGERARIDGSGRLLLGTTSASPANSYSDNLVVSEAAANAGISIHGNNSNSNYASLYFGDAGSAQRSYLETQLGSNGNFTVGTTGSGQIRFNNSGGERLRIEGDGRIKATTSGLYVQTSNSGSGNSDGLALHVDGQTDAYLWNYENTSLRFGTNNTERARFDNTGNLLIGSSFASAHGDRLLQVGKTDRASTYISVVNNTSGVGGLLFADTTTNDTGGYRGQVAYSHSTDAMQFWAAATERMRLRSDGILSVPNGVELGAAFNGGAANTLDDYEEGTWTPSISSFTTTGTVTTAGKYVKVGRQVTFGLRFKSTGTIAYGVSCNISLPFAMNYGDAHNGLVNMMLNSNSASQDNNRNGNQCKLDGEGGSRFFVGSFTTTTSGQELFFGGTYISHS